MFQTLYIVETKGDNNVKLVTKIETMLRVKVAIGGRNGYHTGNDVSACEEQVVQTIERS